MKCTRADLDSALAAFNSINTAGATGHDMRVALRTLVGFPELDKLRAELPAMLTSDVLGLLGGGSKPLMDRFGITGDEHADGDRDDGEAVATAVLMAAGIALGDELDARIPARSRS